MRPYVVGGACHRVKQQLDNALAEGVLELSPELAAHAARCPHCGVQVRETEQLFKRLRTAPASLDLGPVPGVVDVVVQQIATESPADSLVRLSPPGQSEEGRQGSRRAHLRWVLGQVAAIAAVLCVAVGGLTYLALRVNYAVGGQRPAEVVERWVGPLQNWSTALFRQTK